MRVHETFACPRCDELTCKVDAQYVIAQQKTQSVPAIPAHFDDIRVERTCSCDVDGELLDRDAGEALERALLSATSAERTLPTFGDQGLPW